MSNGKSRTEKVKKTVNKIATIRIIVSSRNKRIIIVIIIIIILITFSNSVPYNSSHKMRYEY